MQALSGLYHPGKLDAESFISSFILRLKEFERIMDNLKGQTKKPLQHFLITGKRGMGKSTMLRRIYLEAKIEPYKDKLIAVHLGSEQYKISRLYKLWEEVITILSLEEESLIKKREELAGTPHYEEYIIQIISDYLNSQNKTLLLLIDNFGQLINKFTPKEQHEFREVLIQHPIQIIGSTVFYNSNFFKYDKPFYDFFKAVNLKNLDKKESELFIQELAKIGDMEDFEETLKSQKEKIETLRILSGGVPRMLVILLIILSKKSTGDSIDSLNEMLEMVTPLYQDRMNALSSQQQEIMHHLAKHWDRVPVKELAKDTRIPSKSISAQLSQLEEGGYINKVRTSKRNYFYEIDERFFNIWLLMSEFSTYESKRVMWLTKWLDLFYDSKELEEYASFRRPKMMSSKPTNQFLVLQALAESQKIALPFRIDLINSIIKDLSTALPEIKEWVKCYVKQHGNEVESFLYRVESNNLQDFISGLLEWLPLIDPNESMLYYVIGFLYFIKLDYDKGEEFLLLAINKGNDKAIVLLGYLSQLFRHDLENAEQYYLMGINKGNAEAMVLLGKIYENEKNNDDKAEEYYQMAVDKGYEKAMVVFGDFNCYRRRDYKKAEKYYLMGVARENEEAIYHLASFYYLKNDISKKTTALEMLDSVVTNSLQSVNFPTRIEILLWNENINRACHEFENILTEFEENNSIFWALNTALLAFLTFKQSQFLFRQFSEIRPLLKDQYKPIYFALMMEMKLELPDEYLKIPDELVEPVNNLLELVNNKRRLLNLD